MALGRLGKEIHPLLNAQHTSPEEHTSSANYWGTDSVKDRIHSDTMFQSKFYVTVNAPNVPVVQIFAKTYRTYCF